MAPNKKKKKPAANPARGFTTVSVPSKQKATPSEEPDPPEDAPRDDPKDSEARSSQPHTESAPSGTQRELGELSPEELERHLEEAELHSIVDKYASKCKSDASRQATKLERERRLLRPQSHPLAVMNWLPPELLDQILEKEKKEHPQSYISNGYAEDSSKAATEEELCAKFWTLQQTLLELGIPEHRTDEVLKSIPAYSSGDPLDQMLEWLAMNCDESELPHYGERKPSTAAFQIGEVDSATSGTATPQDDGLGTQKPNTSQPITPLDSSSDESDFSDDPQSLIPRYVSLKSRLYEIQPSIFNGTKKKTSKAKARKDVDSESDPKAAKLKHKLTAIEKDMLFDSHQADEAWNEKLEELRMGTAESSRQKLEGRATDTKEEEPSVENQAEKRPQEKGPVNDNESEHEDDLLGDMFLSEPGDSALETSILPSGIPMVKKHRDFGKSAGMSPRRVLEDACRARDAGYRINYRDMSTAPHSHQKLVEIKWSKTQSMPSQVPLDDISCTADSKMTTVSMASIATPTSQQAELFISVVALFLIFSPSPKESRVFMRLSSPWRDLWDELVETKQGHEEKENMSAVKNIKSLMQENRARFDEDVVLTHNFKRRNGTATPKEPEPLTQAQNKPEDEEKSKQLWKARSSRGSFKEMLVGRQSLPIWQFKQQILEVLSENQALIICSETGSGKSTQIPSFILENELAAGRHCKIYVTEPRRISAMSLAKRVSEELGEGKNAVGTNNSLVGYAIRLESKTTASTRLIFATTGVVIRMLERSQEFRDITHLVLDEVHERTIDSDFLLIILRRLLEERPDLKLVLMSATVNAQRFSDYLNGAPILDIPGRTYPVEVQYLEDVVALTEYGSGERHQAADTDDSDEESPERTPQSEQGLSSSLANYSKWTRDAVTKYDEYRMDYELIIRLLSSIATNPKLQDYSKAVLIFMPGLAEIRRLHDEIMSQSLFEKGWMVYSLHSSVATEDQEKAFQIPPKGVRKIVIATNIAETGITIPDVTAVIDTGKEKVMRFDEKRQISRLVESFISRANAKQRRGRAGRVQNGICFHLFTKYRHDSILPAEQTPEMLRLSLQDLILRVKICNLGDIEGTLAEALDPPSAKNIRRAIDALKEVKALTEGEGLTSLGRQLARLPLDVFLGKLILYGTVFWCLDAAVSIAAILSCKSPFVATVGSSSQKDLARKSFDRGDSDLLTLYNAYSAWKKSRSTPGMSEFAFCRKNSLSPQALLNIEDVKTQLIVSIVDMGLLKLDDDELATLRRARFTSRQRQFFTIPSRIDTNSSNDVIVNSVVAWSFYPRLLTREGKGWRSVANNRTVTLHPTSVNKRSEAPLKWLSYYHIMQTRGRNYNAHETSAVEDIAVALLCGDVAFKMYSGIITIDGSRIRFAVQDWKSLLALKTLSTRIREVLAFTFRDPKAVLSSRQAEWLQLWQQLFSVQGRQTERSQGPGRVKMR